VEANVNDEANDEGNEINRNDDKRAKNIVNSFVITSSCICICVCI
jgi:hypothetical protein